MPNVSSFGAQTDNSVVQGTVTDRAMVIPDIPPQGLMSVGPRVTPHFVKPSLWSALTTYHFFDAVHDAAGASYVAIKPEVPAGTELTDEGYWFLWADPNSQFADLSELVKTYNGRIKKNTEDIEAEITRATSAETTLDGKIEAEITRATSAETTLDGKINDSTLTEMVIIGDSYSDASNPRNIWWKNVAQKLNVTPHCYAKSGTGYIAGSPIFNTQIQNISDINVNKVKYVFIYGGLNDIASLNNKTGTRSQWINNFNTTISSARDKFPNAIIVVCGVNTWQDFTIGDVSTTRGMTSDLEYLCSREKNVIFINTMYACFADPSCFSQEDKHPTTLGSRIIGNAIMQAFATTIPSDNELLNYSQDVTVGNEGVATFRYQYTPNGLLVELTVNAHQAGSVSIPVPNNLQAFISKKNVTLIGISTSGAIAYGFKLNPINYGNIQLTIPTGHENEGYYFPPFYA